jgi:hypothetical protein
MWFYRRGEHTIDNGAIHAHGDMVKPDPVITHHTSRQPLSNYEREPMREHEHEREPEHREREFDYVETLPEIIVPEIIEEIAETDNDRPVYADGKYDF